MKTPDLIDLPLDWAVACCEKLPVWAGDYYAGGESGCALQVVRWPNGAATLKWVGGGAYSPSTDWAQGGLLIWRERISFEFVEDEEVEGCLAYTDAMKGPYHSGPTPLIAAMRAFVASKLGDEVDIPKELL